MPSQLAFSKTKIPSLSEIAGYIELCFNQFLAALTKLGVCLHTASLDVKANRDDSKYFPRLLVIFLQHQSISLPPQVVKNEEVNSMNNAVIPSLPEVALPNTISISPQEMIHTNGGKK
jgi:hypothetical protein